MPSLIYPARPYPMAPSPASPSEVIYRPVVPIRATGPHKTKLYYALLDTGADDVKMPLSEAAVLGVPLDRSRSYPFRGIGGEVFSVFGQVHFELRQSPRSYRWSAHVAFVPDTVEYAEDDPVLVTLGHTGFFRYFHAAFDFQRNRVRIRPNGLFARVAAPAG